MLELRVDSLAGTHAVAAAVASLARSGDVIVLSGEMGSGKTAFAQGVGRALGVEEPITSPTFTLVHRYDLPAGAGTSARVLHHADLYRLDRTDEVLDLALPELAEDDGIVLVEWGEVADALLGDHLAVHLEPDPFDDGPDAAEDGVEGEVAVPTARLIELSAVGATWASRWSRLVDACEEFAC